MDKCLISIIMPTYNAEKTIEKAAYSCINQTLDSVELIIVDDCSTDSTKDIINALQKENPNKVRAIFQETNCRQGAARNKGFSIARGEYILFVDSDDWIELDACEKLYNKASQNKEIEVLVANYSLVYDNGEKKNINTFESAAAYLGKQDINTHTALIQQAGYFWCKMYKRTFLQRAFPDGILFPERMQYEDAAFNTLATIQSNYTEKLDYSFYNYYQNPNSTVKNIITQLDKIKVAKFLLGTKFMTTEYKDIILYKSAVLCGAALLYGIFPLWNIETKKCRLALKEIRNLTSVFINGTHYELVPEGMRYYLEANFKHHYLFIFKQILKGKYFKWIKK